MCMRMCVIICMQVYVCVYRIKILSSRVAWGILGRGVYWVSGLPTFLKSFFNDVLEVLETSHVKQMCSLLPKVSFVTSALF